MNRAVKPFIEPKRNYTRQRILCRHHTHPAGMLPDTSYQAVSPQPSPPPSPHGPPTPGMPGGLQRGADSGSPHATSMPRPISAESLGRVESLAEMAGVQIPRIRTRPQVNT